MTYDTALELLSKDFKVRRQRWAKAAYVRPRWEGVNTATFTPVFCWRGCREGIRYLPREEDKQATDWEKYEPRS